MDPYQRYLDGHRSTRPAHPEAGTPMLSIEIHRLSGPDDALEELAERELAKTPRERRVAGRRRMQQQSALLIDADGTVTLGGKTCCLGLLRKLQANLERLVVPSTHTCSCNTTWELRYTVRREVLRAR